MTQMSNRTKNELPVLDDNFHFFLESHLLDQQFGQMHTARVSDFNDLCMDDVRFSFYKCNHL
jgi:hypothetical protein